MRAGVAQHYHFRAVIRGFLTGRSAKIKWVLLQHLIRKGHLHLSSQLVLEWWQQEEEQHPALCHHIKVPVGKGLTFLSCPSALGSTDGQGGISLLTPWCHCSSQTLNNLLGVQGLELHKVHKMWVHSCFREGVLSFPPFLPFLIYGLPLLLPDVEMSGWECLPISQTLVPKGQGPGKSVSLARWSTASSGTPLQWLLFSLSSITAFCNFPVFLLYLPE